jgi:hypothetical protein
MKLAFILCISLVYLGYVNAALLGGWGDEETATSEIQGYVNGVSIMSFILINMKCS